tara:strand:+ start:370 stop:768 length:399 start_codon:yes stop_codon:yes gene_type:complete
MAKDNQLLTYIRERNAQTLAWVEAGEGRWATTLVEDTAHWAEYEITTPAELDYYLAACCYVDMHKSACGVKPAWPSAETTSIDTLEKRIARLSKEIEEDLEAEKRERDAGDAAERDALTPTPDPTLGDLLDF